MEMQFTSFLQKFPIEYGEGIVIERIHDTMHCAMKAYKEDSDSAEYLKYLSKAYYMMETYFTEKGVHPDSFK